MALEVQLSQTISVLKQSLDKRYRYRCLIIQGNEMSALSQVSYQIQFGCGIFESEVKEIDAMKQFDDIGALSCNCVIGKIKSLAYSNPVLISGPLHFLDYWSPSVRMVFWNFMATFSNGPGVIVTDVFRSETVLGPFHLIDGFRRSDLRCLKSRLEFTQDPLA